MSSDFVLMIRRPFSAVVGPVFQAVLKAVVGSEGTRGPEDRYVGFSHGGQLTIHSPSVSFNLSTYGYVAYA